VHTNVVTSSAPLGCSDWRHDLFDDPASSRWGQCTGEASVSDSKRLIR